MTIAADIEALWHNHHAELLRYVRQRVPRDQVEDAVQDIFLRALEAMHKGIGTNNHARGWMHRIAHNLVIDYYRKRDRLPDMLDIDESIDGDAEQGDTYADALADDAPTPHEQAEAAEVAEQVHCALDAIPSYQAEIIRLRWLEGYAFTEIATEQGKTTGAVKAAQQRGMLELRQVFMGARKPGQEKDPRCVLLRQLFTVHGPLAMGDLLRLMRLPRSTVYYVLTTNNDFTRLGKGNYTRWTLAEEYQQEAA